jgi:non-canonical poly(A) RNA polymerase PAPD5/7
MSRHIVSAGESTASTTRLLTLQLHPKLRRGDIDPEQNLGTLLVEFFELYGRNYCYDEVGISIRRGGAYFTKRSKGWYKPNQPYLLCIEDPQDQSELAAKISGITAHTADNDISSGSYGIRQVKNTLAGAYEMLQARLFERAEQISGRRSGRYEGSRDPEDMSILTGVMGITKEVSVFCLIGHDVQLTV